MDYSKFIADLESSSPAPGGGAASALYGVLGSALASMVCALTEGRQKYKDNETFVISQHKKILNLKEKLEKMMDADVEAFMQISAAYKLPRNTEEEKTERSKTIQNAMIPATETPLKIMQLAAEGLDIVNSLIGKTNAMAISDLGCAVLGFKSAIQGAYLNVKINLSSTKNPNEEFAEISDRLMKKYLPLSDKIYDKVLTSL